MIVKVTQITFDLSTDNDVIPYEDVDLVQKELQQEYINTQWTVIDEDDLVDEISCHSGWLIESIEYVEV